MAHRNFLILFIRCWDKGLIMYDRDYEEFEDNVEDMRNAVANDYVTEMLIDRIREESYASDITNKLFTIARNMY